MQHAALSHEIEIAAWLDHFDYSSYGGPGPTDELNIGCALSEESASVARALIELWIDSSITLKEMKSAIDAALRSHLAGK
jgi:hypothetical protein